MDTQTEWIKLLTGDSENDWLRLAVFNDPRDSICGWCGGINEFVDDCGFIYITPYGDDTRPACENCYRGAIGEMHIKRYGVGER